MGLMSRNKGKVGEREVVVLLNALLGDLAQFSRNHNQADGFRESVERKDIQTNLPLAVEVKRTEAKTWRKFLEQARRQAGPQELPVLFHRANGEQWKVVLDLSPIEFCKLIRAFLYWQSQGSPGERGQADIKAYLEAKKEELARGE
jgi:hypothetical protein